MEYSISIFLNVLRLVSKSMIYFEETSTRFRKEDIFCLGEMYSKYWFYQFILCCQLAPVFLFSLCLEDLSIGENGILESLTNSVLTVNM